MTRSTLHIFWINDTVAIEHSLKVESRLVTFLPQMSVGAVMIRVALRPEKP